MGKLLYYSGGALNLNKYSWYAMAWDWKQGRPTMRQITADNPCIKLTQASDLRGVEIKRLELLTSSRVLGIYQNPLGDFKDHLDVLKDKADQYSRYLKSPRLSPTDIRVFHKTVYGPAMRYSLPALAVDEEELGRVQSQILPTMVQWLGFSSKMPTAIRHGPVSMWGLGLIDLRTEYGIEMINMFRHAVYSQTQVGQLLLLEVQATQLEAGIPTPILEHPGLHIQYLTPNWVLLMRQFMYNHNISITITNSLQLKLASPSDMFIMSLVGNSGYSKVQQQDINRVWIYLQVTTLADLTDSTTPNKITSWGLNAARPISFEAKDFWPRQCEPSATQRRLWRRYISSQFLRYGLFWRKSPRVDSQEHTQDPIEHSSSSTTANLYTLIRKLPTGKRRLLSHLHKIAPDGNIWKACRSKRSITIASDGGLQGNRGTFGWHIRSASNKVLAEGAGPVDGPFDVANSTRCELCGYAASLLFLSLFYQLWGCRHKCRIRWVTDSKSAIAKVNHSQQFPLGRRQPDNSDRLTIIKEEGQMCTKRRTSSIWIKGHQSIPRNATQGRRYQDILGNNRADGLATWYRDESGKCQSKENTDHIASNRITISINGTRLVGQVESCIRYHINGYQLRQYIQSKNKWNNKTWNRIDVEGLGRFHSRLSPSHQVAHTKFMFDQWHTGTKRLQVSRIDDTQIAQCPCCKCREETPSHILRCTANPSREKCLLSLRKSLTFSNTINPALQAFKTCIMAWLREESPMNDLKEYPEKFRLGITQALKDQDAIGWHSALKGYLSVEWRYLFTLGIGDDKELPEGIGMHRFRTVVQSLTTFATEVWKSRNQV